MVATGKRWVVDNTEETESKKRERKGRGWRGDKIKEIRRRGKCKQEEPTVAELHSTPRCGIIVWGKTAAKWPLTFWVWTIPDTWCMGGMEISTPRETNERNRTAVNWRENSPFSSLMKRTLQTKRVVEVQSNTVLGKKIKKTLKNLNPKCRKLNGTFVENRNEDFSRLQEF